MPAPDNEQPSAFAQPTGYALARGSRPVFFQQIPELLALHRAARVNDRSRCIVNFRARVAPRKSWGRLSGLSAARVGRSSTSSTSLRSVARLHPTLWSGNGFRCTCHFSVLRSSITEARDAESTGSLTTDCRRLVGLAVHAVYNSFISHARSAKHPGGLFLFSARFVCDLARNFCSKSCAKMANRANRSCRFATCEIRLR